MPERGRILIWLLWEWLSLKPFFRQVFIREFANIFWFCGICTFLFWSNHLILRLFFSFSFYYVSILGCMFLIVLMRSISSKLSLLYWLINIGSFHLIIFSYLLYRPDFTGYSSIAVSILLNSINSMKES